MTRYLLDTNIVSSLMREPSGPAARMVRNVGDADLCTSIMVVAELRFGIARAGARTLAERLKGILLRLPVQPFVPPQDETYGQVRAELERRGALIGANDMVIAAQALALDCTLVTDNEREFRRVRGLRVENWLRKKA